VIRKGSTGFGGRLLLTNPGVRDRPGVLKWLVGAVILHDGIVAPALHLLGLGARRRAPLRRPFVAAGSLTAVAIPVLARPARTADPSCRRSTTRAAGRSRPVRCAGRRCCSRGRGWQRRGGAAAET
jgi:hypothetical protein